MAASGSVKLLRPELRMLQSTRQCRIQYSLKLDFTMALRPSGTKSRLERHACAGG